VSEGGDLIDTLIYHRIIVNTTVPGLYSVCMSRNFFPVRA